MMTSSLFIHAPSQLTALPGVLRSHICMCLLWGNAIPTTVVTWSIWTHSGCGSPDLKIRCFVIFHCPLLSILFNHNSAVCLPNPLSWLNNVYRSTSSGSCELRPLHKLKGHSTYITHLGTLTSIALILSYLILSCLILSCLILSYPNLSYPITTAVTNFRQVVRSIIQHRIILVSCTSEATLCQIVWIKCIDTDIWHLTRHSFILSFSR